jgi:hypothetical protein
MSDSKLEEGIVTTTKRGEELSSRDRAFETSPHDADRTD